MNWVDFVDFLLLGHLNQQISRSRDKKNENTGIKGSQTAKNKGNKGEIGFSQEFKGRFSK